MRVAKVGKWWPAVLVVVLAGCSGSEVNDNHQGLYGVWLDEANRGFVLNPNGWGHRVTGLQFNGVLKWKADGKELALSYFDEEGTRSEVRKMHWTIDSGYSKLVTTDNTTKASGVYTRGSEMASLGLALPAVNEPVNIAGSWQGLARGADAEPSSPAAEVASGFVFNADGSGYTLSPNFELETRITWKLDDSKLSIAWRIGHREITREGIVDIAADPDTTAIRVSPTVHPGGTIEFRRI